MQISLICVWWKSDKYDYKMIGELIIKRVVKRVIKRIVKTYLEDKCSIKEIIY